MQKKKRALGNSNDAADGVIGGTERHDGESDADRPRKHRDNAKRDSQSTPPREERKKKKGRRSSEQPQCNAGAGEEITQSESVAVPYNQRPILLRARNCLGGAFTVPDPVPMSMFLLAEIVRELCTDLPKYRRTVSWIPTGAVIFYLFFREKHRIVYAPTPPMPAQEAGSLHMQTALDQRDTTTAIASEPETLLFFPDLAIPIQGGVNTHLQAGAPSNTCLVCAFGDEVLDGENQLPAPGRCDSPKSGDSDSASSHAKSRDLARNPKIYVFDIAMYNGVLFKDTHPVYRQRYLDMLSIGEKIPADKIAAGCSPIPKSGPNASFRVQEIMDQCALQHHLPFLLQKKRGDEADETPQPGEPAEPHVRKTVVELTNDPLKPLLY